MKKILVVTNPQKDENLEVTNRVCDYIAGKGVACELFVLEHRSSSIPENAAAGCEACVVLGGDGTLMRVAKQVNDFDIPIVGINTGHLGFLARIDKNKIEEALDKLVSGNFKIEERMLVTGRVYQEGKCIFEADALNDVVITRGGSLQVLNFDVEINNKPLKSYSADGVIVSTPTGSTGYNLSAGGPIVSPGADMMVLTPIAPHTLVSRSIIFESYDEIKIVIGKPHDSDVEQTVEVCFDGGRRTPLNAGDYVSINKADKAAKFILLDEVNFLEILSQKMREN